MGVNLRLVLVQKLPKKLAIIGGWAFIRTWALIENFTVPISAYSGLVKFDMKIFVNVARLEIGQLFTQCTRWGHLCTLDTLLVSMKSFYFGFSGVFKSMNFFVLVTGSRPGIQSPYLNYDPAYITPVSIQSPYLNYDLA